MIRMRYGLALFGLTGLMAQSPGLQFSVSARGLTGGETVQGMNQGLGFGLAAALPLGKGALRAELGYQYLAGKLFRESIPPYQVGGVTTTQDNSVHTKRNELNGLMLRLGYARSLGESGFSLHGGAAVGRMKAKHESIGTFWTYGDGMPDGAWTLTSEESGMVVWPYLGVEYRFSATGSFQANLLYASYRIGDTSATFHPTSGALNQVRAQVGSRTVDGVKLELAYAFHF